MQNGRRVCAPPRIARHGPAELPAHPGSHRLLWREARQPKRPLLPMLHPKHPKTQTEFVFSVSFFFPPFSFSFSKAFLRGVRQVLSPCETILNWSARLWLCLPPPLLLAFHFISSFLTHGSFLPPPGLTFSNEVDLLSNKMALPDLFSLEVYWPSSRRAATAGWRDGLEGWRAVSGGRKATASGDYTSQTAPR